VSFPRYDSYKDSGIAWLGDMPSQWETRRLRTLFEIRKRIAGVEGRDVLSITQRGIRIRDTSKNEGQIAENYSRYQIVEPGDFAMNHMDLLTGWVDISFIKGVTSPDYRVFATKGEVVLCQRYMLYIFHNCYSQRIFFAFGQGSSHLGRWRLPTDAFQEFVFPFPTLFEQTAIADFLDRETAKIDGLIEAQRRLIDLLKEKRQAVISHAVTRGLDPTVSLKLSGVEWLGYVPVHWTISQIRHVIELSTSGPRGWSEMLGENGALFFQSRNIGRVMEIELQDAAHINPPTDADTERAELQVGDVVVCITGARTGAVAHVDHLPGKAYINQHVCLIRPRVGNCSRPLAGLLRVGADGMVDGGLAA